MFHRIRAGLGCALVLALPAIVHADISIRLSNEQLAAGADVIVIGRATETQPRWIGRTLFTAVTVRIDESLKGGAEGTIEVLIPGGTDANRKFPVGMTFPGAPTLRPDEQVFLFLSHAGDVGGYVVAGFAQGKFSIVTDARGERRVSRDLRGSQLVEGTGISVGTVTMVPLSVFRQEIVNYLAQ